MSKKPYHDTKVTASKSRAGIDRLLEKWGVEGVQWTTFGIKTALRFQFRFEDRVYNARLMIDPETQGDAFSWSFSGDRGKAHAKHFDRESRRLHRTLYWYVKSKLEAIEAGLETPTQAWLAAIEGPRGHTMYEELAVSLRGIEAGNLATMPALPAARNEVQEAEFVEGS